MGAGHERARAARAFTLIELLAVVAIIMVLAALLYSAATAAYRSAKVNRSKAVLEILATACENYWAGYHDYPYPSPDVIGCRDDTGNNDTLSNYLKPLGSIYYSGGKWTERAYNVGLVYLLSAPRQPEAFLNTSQSWFQAVKMNDTASNPAVTGPQNRPLFTVVDGFQMNDGSPSYVRVQRSDTQNPNGPLAALDPDDIAQGVKPNYQNTYVKLTSRGPDLVFTGKNPKNGMDYTKDNIDRYVRR